MAQMDFSTVIQHNSPESTPWFKHFQINLQWYGSSEFRWSIPKTRKHGWCWTTYDRIWPILWVHGQQTMSNWQTKLPTKQQIVDILRTVFAKSENLVLRFLFHQNIPNSRVAIIECPQVFGQLLGSLCRQLAGERYGERYGDEISDVKTNYPLVMSNIAIEHGHL